MVWSSREVVRCGHSGCKYKSQRRLLKRHNNSCHPGMPLLEMSGFSRGYQWASWITSSASGSTQAAGQSKSAQTAVNVPPPSPAYPTIQRQSPMEVDVQPSSMYCDVSTQTFTSISEVSNEVTDSISNALKSLEAKIEAIMSHQEAEPTPSNPITVLTTSSVLLKFRVLEAKLDRLVDAKKAQTEISMATGTDVYQSRNVRSISELLVSTDSTFKTEESFNCLYCTVCVTTPPSSEPRVSTFGILKYDFGKGTSFNFGALPIHFRNVKVGVKSHLVSSRHLKNAENQQRETQRQKKKQMASRNTVISLLRTGYHVIHESHSQEEYEKLVVLQHMNGGRVGDIGHSSSQMAKQREAFSSVILDKIGEHCLKAPCISLMADKVTLDHRTVDIIAITTIVPAAPPEELFQCMVIDAPVVTGHDGQSLANQWCTSLARVKIDNVNKVAAVCADGQYFGVGAPELLQNTLSKSSVGTPCLIARWDDGHLVELATNKVFGLYNWVGETVAVITDVTKKFRHGKGYENLRALAATRKFKFLNPTLWSTVRWSTYAGGVLHRFLHNLPLYLELIQKQSSKDLDKKTITVLQEKCSLLEVHASALHDIYLAVGRASKTLQSIQCLPWERQEAFEGLSQRLSEMSACISRQPARCGPLDTRDIADLLDVGEDEMAELWPTLFHCCKDPASEVREYIGEFTKSLFNEMTKRMDGVDARGSRRGSQNAVVRQAMGDIRAAADLTNLRSSPGSGCVALALDAIKRLQSRRMVPVDATQFPLAESFLAIRKLIRSTDLKESTTNQQLYKLVHKQSLTCVELKPALDVVTRLWLICPCESVVESMGSVLKDIFGPLRHLDHVNSSKELIIRWNGPPVAQASRLLGIVSRSGKFNFQRSSSSFFPNEGTVISRHMRSKFASASLFE